MIAIALGLTLLAPPAPTFRAWYMMWDVDTLIPVTAENIERCYEVTSLLSRSRGELMDLLGKVVPGEEFSWGGVRLKIVTEEGTWLVDQEGAVRHGGRSWAFRTPKDFVWFKAKIAGRLPLNTVDDL